jgi:cobalamin synthase
MDQFLADLKSWQVFYATVAASSATLTGLLFVSLSLNRGRLKGEKAQPVVDMARGTFGNFLYVLMIALVFLVPHQLPLSLTIALLVLGISRGLGLLLEVIRTGRNPHFRRDSHTLIREVGLPAIACLGLILVAVAVGYGKTELMYGLVFVIAALLGNACWNAWLLLMEE